MTTPPTPTTEIALLRSELLLLLADLKGDVRLILQRSEQNDQRAAEHAEQIRRLDDRQDAFERDYVPLQVAAVRADLQREIASVREEAKERSRKTIQVIGIIAAICGSVAGVLAAIIIAITQ